MFVGVGVAERSAVLTAKERWSSALEYHAERPYLKTPAAMQHLIGDEGQAWLAEQRKNHHAVPHERASAEQRELDERTAAAEVARRRQPKHRLGHVPAEGGVVTLVTSMFVHAGLLHLLGNLLYLFFSGPFVEDVFGRPLFALLYFGGGVAATLLHASQFAESTIPLVGASGAIAAVMGAYLVRFARSKVQFLFIPILYRPDWSFRFWLPAFVVLPIWFAQQLWGMRSEAQTGIGFSAHVGGFVFGAVFALVVRLTRVEERYVNPAIVKQTSWSLDERLVRAMDARHRGETAQAKTELASVLRDGQASVEALQLAVDLARDDDDPAALDSAAARLLARHLERKETTLAEDLIREVTSDRFARLPRFLARAAAFAERSGERDWALALYERLYEVDPGSVAAVNALMKIGALRRFNGDFRGAREALAKARQHPLGGVDSFDRGKARAAGVRSEGALELYADLRTGSVAQLGREAGRAAGAGEQLRVAAESRIVAQLREQRLEQARHARTGGLGERVVNPLSVATRLRQPGPAQIGEMARDLRLRLVEHAHEVADARLAEGEQVQEAQPGAIGQRGEEIFEGGLFHIRADVYYMNRRS